MERGWGSQEEKERQNGGAEIWVCEYFSKNTYIFIGSGQSAHQPQNYQLLSAPRRASAAVHKPAKGTLGPGG